MGCLRFAMATCSLLVLAGCGGSAHPPQAGVDNVQSVRRQSPTAPLVTIGTVSIRPKHEIEAFKPLARYLAGELRVRGMGGCNVVVAASMDEMARLMREGNVDIYIDSPFPVVRVGELCGATPILRRWKNGQETYRGVVFARRGSGIASVEDLKGRVIAFDEEFSTAGYVLPISMLLQLGLTLTKADDASRKIPSDEVGYVFSSDDENTFLWVSRGKVAAGATSNVAFEQLTRDRPREFLIVAETGPVPRHVVCHRAGLSPALVAIFKDILVNMADSELGRKTLAEFQQTAKFDEFPQGADAALAPIRDCGRLLEGGLQK